MNLQFPEQEHLNCPRCDSNNTKFCYYNNYNLSQPRHYCKNCRRYWTKGGTLRKIPIGGGTRKSTKRSSSSNKRPAAVSHSDPSTPASNSIVSTSDGSDVNKSVETGVFQVTGESSSCDGGDVWANLSVFRSG